MKMPCFECGNPAEHLHHVVPKSLGGTKTVPLCKECHSKVHAPESSVSGSLLSKISLIPRRPNKLTFEIGLQIIDLAEKGMTTRQIGESMGLSHDLVWRTIKGKGKLPKAIHAVRDCLSTMQLNKIKN